MIHMRTRQGDWHAFSCGVEGEASGDVSKVTCAECLYHMITGALEQADRELDALEYCRLLAQLQHPNMIITVAVGPALPTYAELA